MKEIIVGAASDTGKVRSSNQDHYLVQRSVGNRSSLLLRMDATAAGAGSCGILCAVADGMGGHQGGEQASRLALEVLAQQYFAADRGAGALATPESRLRNAVEAADRAVRDEGSRQRHLFGMGTTVVGLLLYEDGACAFNAGDSRLYRLRREGLEQLSSDHSLVAELQRSGQLTPEQAETFDRKQVLTNCVGGYPEMDFYLETYPGIGVSEGDRFLLCSDGVSNAIPREELEYLCRNASDPEAVASDLVRESDERGGLDNATAVVIDVR